MTAIDVQIEKLVYGGDGLAHHAGQTLFVPFVLPGERVLVQPLRHAKKLLRGHPEKLLVPSPERTQAPCPHFGICGGCHYQHIPYPMQLRLKTEILRETLSRIGRVQWQEAITVHESPAFGYRSRAQWTVRAANADSMEIGYFQAGTSSLCPVDHCPILSPRVLETFAILREALTKGLLPGGIREIEASADSEDQQVLLNISFEKFPAPPDALADMFRRLLPSLASVLLHERSSERFELIGPGFITYKAGQNRYRAGHLSFFQVNRFLAESLVQHVAGDARGGLALDLFAGVGLFTIPLARQFEKVAAVDANVAAIRDLKANLQENGVAAQVTQGDASQFLRRLREKPDFVVLDPPRAGLAANAIAPLLALRAPEIMYLSCDPATLARDLAALTASTAQQERSANAARYVISEVHLFDLFPQTYHIESLVRLRLQE